MHIPSSTYRIQLHKGFTLKALQRIVDYLHTLGVSDIYASPITEATPDSMHGYDVTDPHTINPEIGDIDDLRALAHELRKKNMHWLQDIVPNHMAFHRTNFRLADVLERGPDSPYYHYFDINWNHPSPALKGKVMVPFLGDQEEKCLSRGEIKLAFSPSGFRVMYLDTPYPLSLSAYPLLSEQAKASGPGTTLPAIFTKMLAAAKKVDLETWSNISQEFLYAITEDETNTSLAAQVVARVNGDAAILKKLLDIQYYRLSYWKSTDTCINYRRFFTVNELICLRMEDEDVFNEYHTYLGKLLKEKLIQGLRIDHIDGLYDPAKYTQRLRKLAGEACYIIAEKILEAKEEMPGQWPLQGTSGYEFLSYMNQLLTLRKGARQLREFYHDLLPEMPSYEELIMDSKRLILENYIRGEWENLTSLLESLGLSNGIAHERLREALGFFMLSLPVYRIYPDTLPLKGKSLLVVQEAFDKALKHGADYAQEIDYLRDLLTNPRPGDDGAEAILAFLRRMMQFTGPLTAKGVEDTTFYIYNPLISHDEVGDSPAPLGMSVQRFHEKMSKRQADTPYSLNATATHDTKRGEDARVRINVLSRIPELWIEHVSKWLTINQPFRTSVAGRTAPELNDEYFIYQSIVGGFPEDFRVTDEWIGRVQSYLNKALREAKVNTSWSDPDEQYERACEKFITQILDGRHSFLETFIPFVKIVCDHAMVYSLSQTLLKLTAPGIPDVYQGCELWDLSFVDPDNRRPVDFDKRMEFLFQMVLKGEKGTEEVLGYLEEQRENGIEKLYLMWKVLNFRKDHSQLFIEGAYIPLSLTGKEAAAASFARALGDMWTITAIPLGLVKHDMEEDDPFSSQFLVLPENAPAEWYNLLTGETFEAANQFSLRDIFKTFPVAFLVSG